MTHVLGGKTEGLINDTIPSIKTTYSSDKIERMYGWNTIYTKSDRSIFIDTVGVLMPPFIDGQDQGYPSGNPRRWLVQILGGNIADCLINSYVGGGTPVRTITQNNVPPQGEWIFIFESYIGSNNHQTIRGWIGIGGFQAWEFPTNDSEIYIRQPSGSSTYQYSVAQQILVPHYTYQ